MLDRTGRGHERVACLTAFALEDTNLGCFGVKQGEEVVEVVAHNEVVTGEGAVVLSKSLEVLRGACATSLGILLGSRVEVLGGFHRRASKRFLMDS